MKRKNNIGCPMPTEGGGPAVKIMSVEEKNGIVTVEGTSWATGLGKVEVIVNGDLDLRYVANHDENGAWRCRFKLSYRGEYSIEASVRDYTDFNRIRQATPDENCFLLEDANVWGATVTRHTDGFILHDLLYLGYSRGI